MKKYIVSVPIADLRREPLIHLGSYEKDPLQETQLLYGEKLLGEKEIDGWIYVEALEQQVFKKDKWQGYPGWVKREQVLAVHSFVSTNLVVIQSFIMDFKVFLFGTKLNGVAKTRSGWVVKLPNGKHMQVSSSCVIAADLVIKKLISYGKQFVGTPYLWGGRSLYIPESKDQITSVDCSGFTNLLYRVCGVDIPRDAHDQFLKSSRIESKDLKLADLVFMAHKDKPHRMDHVMLYAGKDLLLEAAMENGQVRFIKSEERFGIELSQISSGDHVKDYIFYFGRVELVKH